MAIAGLWDRWRSKDKTETKESYAVIVGPANQFCGKYHDRMPVIIEPEDFETWLNADPDEPAKLMRAAKEELVTCRTVNKAAGNVKNNGPELLA